MANKVTFQYPPGDFIQLYSPYNPNLINDIKNFPGSKWNKDRRCWEIPKELEDNIETVVKNRGFNVFKFPKLDNIHIASIPDSRLYDYQMDCVERGINDGKLMINFETGLGKTPVAIDIIRQLKPKKILIICPAIVIGNWLIELNKWWENCQYTLNIVRDKDSEIDYTGETITLISYGMIDRVENEKFDTIIIDEIHYVKNFKAKRSEKVKNLCHNNKDSIILGLTATPVANEPADIWHQLECLWPGRFGWFWKFANTYANVEEHEWGPKVFGVNPLRADELKKRLDAVSVRVTKKEVAHLLPPLMAKTIRLSLSNEDKDTLKSINLITLEDSKLKSTMRGLGSIKVPHIVSQVESHTLAGVSHICCLTYYRDIAKKVYENVKDKIKGYKIYHVSGEQSPKERFNIIQEAIAKPKSILIATMSSVGVGIDLTPFTVAVFGELNYSPSAMIQTLGRFSRLSGKLPSTVEFLILVGTIDEIIATRLDEKISNINKLIKSGQAESEIEKIMSIETEDDIQFLNRLNDLVASTDLSSMGDTFSLTP